MSNIKSYEKKHFNKVRDVEKLTDSWYWSVMMKNYGSLKKAKKAFEESQRKINPQFGWTKWGKKLTT